MALLLTISSTAAIAFTRVNPVWVLAVAAVVGVSGLA
jgi:hypothetical protein